jgi:hypothetical protein
MTEYIVYADSHQRDATLYPYGNAYTLHLTSPIHNVTRVELVSAIVPNTMYNLTTTSNVLVIDGTSNIWFNPAFFSSTTLVSVFNASKQVSSTVATMVYLSSEGRFMFYGSLNSIDCKTAEIAKLLGLPLGVTAASTIASNPEYASHIVYGSSTRYVKSAQVIDLGINEYVWLDVAEFRTPTTLDARKLVTSSNLRTTQSNTAATSFALIPMDVTSGSFKSFKAHTDYSVSVQFPSRLDSLERLTIRWLDLNGLPLVFNGLETNSFTLRVHTVTTPIVPERPISLPTPVVDNERNMIFIGSVIALVLGLFVIMFSKRKS